jgi:spore coat protein A
MKITLSSAVPGFVRRLQKMRRRTDQIPPAASQPNVPPGEATGDRRQQRYEALPGLPVSRRALVRAIGAAGGLAALASCTPSAAKKTANPAEDHERGNNGNGQHNDSHGDGQSDGSGSSGRGDPNSGMQTLASDIAVPAQFEVPLPIPQQLPPARRTADTDYYEIVQSAATAEIIPGLKTPIIAYNGTFPGPTIVQKPGRRIVVTHRNTLPVPTVVHLHGGTTPHDSDGYPTDFILPAAAYGSFPTMPAMLGMPDMPAMNDPDAIVSSLRRDYTYPPQPRAGTLWYHDHRMAFTGASVYRGLAGFHIAHDSEEQALPLPRADHDVPLMIADRAFAADGSFRYPALDPTMHTPGIQRSATNGVLGDIILVNGAPWPIMNVDTARYRFRILNASNARTYQLALQDPAHHVGLTQIGTDHGLLPAPIPQATITIAPAQRFDVIIDFSRHQPGDQITLTNQLETGPTAAVMRFTVARTTSDNSSIPAELSKTGTNRPTATATRRTMKFHRGGDGEWQINGRVFDPTYSHADVPAGSTEVWTIISDFHHPFHIHNATMQVISRDGNDPGSYDHGWKDTVFVNKGERVELAIRFSAFKGRYVFHCHNLEHEDMGMMANFRII